MRVFSLSWVLVFLVLSGRSQDLSTLGSAKPFSLNGGISLTSGYYSASGIQARYPEFMYVLNGNITMNVYAFSLPFSFTYGSQEKSYYQPFNQFGMSPTYKWIKLHGGYRSMNFSPFTVAGTTFLGGGIELTPGKLRFGVLYGRFNRKSVFDSLRTDYKPAFERMGMGVKLGVGTENNHIDLIWFKAKDDTAGTSLLREEELITPAENVVLGINTRLLLFKRLKFEGDVAGSVYDRDRTAPRIEITDKQLQFLELLFPLGYSTQVFKAVQSSLQYQAKSWSVKTQYQRIDPDYKSMGAAYFQTDIENMTLGSSISLWKRKIMINGNFGLSHNNLAGNRSSQTSRTIGSLNLAFNPIVAYGFNFQFSNFGISQKAGIAVLNDSMKIVQNNQSFMVSNRYSLIRKKATHTFNLVVNSQNMKDLNPNAVYKNEFENRIVTAGYMLSFRTGLSTGINLTHSDIRLTVQNTKALTISVNASKSFKRKLNLNGNVGFTNATGDSGKGNAILNGGLSASYTLLKKHQFRAALNFMNNQAESGSVMKSYHEFRGNLTYSFNF